VQYGQPLKVGVAVTRLGNKSLDMQYTLQDASNSQALASGSSVLVAYDYHSGKSIPIPDGWRAAITLYEGL
jgi:acyl-CoA thioester hydrolase